jgi:hypothetical protein
MEVETRHVQTKVEFNVGAWGVGIPLQVPQTRLQEWGWWGYRGLDRRFWNTESVNDHLQLQHEIRGLKHHAL